jgi:hypothetical protein
VDAQRISVKVYCEEPGSLASDDCLRVFHTWVRERTLDEVLVDVADYRHVPRGPGVLLVCHHANYGVEEGDGRLGLAFSRKCDVLGTWEERLASAFRSVLTACLLLEQTRAFAQRPRFSVSDLRVRVHDRLRAPNEPESYAALEPGLVAALSRIYGGSRFELTRGTDPDDLVELRVSARGDALSVEQALSRL